MQDFNHILNWKLLKGSHKFPGPDGGTCINEAAIIAAGFKYKEVKSVEDCPPCFSVPIAAYALALNDSMPDNQRHLLLPFVTRLAGTADDIGIEIARMELIAIRTVQLILPPVLSLIGLKDHSTACANVATAAAAHAAAHAAAAAAAHAAAAAAAHAAAAHAAAAHAAAHYAPHKTAIKILNEAIMLGRNSPIAIPIAKSRLDQSRVKVAA